MPPGRTPPILRPLLLALPLLAALLAACSDPPAEDGEEIAEGTRIVVFAPSSLRPALAELAPEIRRQTGLDPDFHFAPSATLARQIEAAANPDVVIVAGESALAPLVDADLLLPDSHHRFLANRLVVIAHPHSDLEIAEARELETAPYSALAVGDPRELPEGIRAKSFLQAVVMPGGHTLWQALGERITPETDTGAVIDAVAGDEATLGIVYASDIHRRDEVRVIYEVPEELSPRIRYIAAGVAGGPAGEAAARAFLDVLRSPSAGRVFQRMGFGGP